VNLTLSLKDYQPLFHSSLPLYSPSHFTTRAPSLETETCVVLWDACVVEMEAGGGNL